MKDDEDNEIPQWIILKAVDAILNEIPFQQFVDLRHRIAESPNWYVEHHFTWGMAVRNRLRETVCPDNELPSGNWDDIYVHVVEEAVRQGNIRLMTGNIRSSDG
ncbi:MAG TPA: hypothetical protein VI338_06560 [Nitrososphaera sp.]|nr:hypothetical protein [Nitrososphaera sp.]